MTEQHGKPRPPGTPPEPPKVTQDQQTTVAGVIGEIVWLMTQSAAHRHYFLSDLEWLVMPPVLFSQYRIFRAEGRPIGLALWAYLNPAAEARIEAGVGRLAPGEWKSGDRLWLIDLVAPFGKTEVMIEDLRHTVFADKTFKLHRRDASGAAKVETIAGARVPADPARPPPTTH